MDGLEEVTAAGVPITIGGKTYRLLPMRAKDWAEAGRYLNARRQKPLEIVTPKVLAALDKESKEFLLEMAYKDERAGSLLPIWEVERWLRTTREGEVFKFWKCISRSHPEIDSMEAAEALLDKINDEEAAQLCRDADAHEGMPLGNSSGRIPSQENPPNGSPSPGAVSSAN